MRARRNQVEDEQMLSHDTCLLISWVLGHGGQSYQEIVVDIWGFNGFYGQDLAVSLIELVIKSYIG